MERLTIRNSDGTVSQPTNTTVERAFYRLAEYEDTGLEPEEIGEMKTAYDENQMPYAIEATGSEAVHIYKLLLAEAQGRLLVLPCRVGDTLYITEPRFYNYEKHEGVQQGVCKAYEMHERYGWVVRVSLEKGEPHTLYFYNLSDFGKTVFLTRKEAEAALHDTNVGNRRAEDG